MPISDPAPMVEISPLACELPPPHARSTPELITYGLRVPPCVLLRSLAPANGITALPARPSRMQAPLCQWLSRMYCFSASPQTMTITLGRTGVSLCPFACHQPLNKAQTDHRATRLALDPRRRYTIWHVPHYPDLRQSPLHSGRSDPCLQQILVRVAVPRCIASPHVGILPGRGTDQHDHRALPHPPMVVNDCCSTGSCSCTGNKARNSCPARCAYPSHR
ncbi:hypothetical protein FQR65_LT20152 [Abscondita terminalis]|nr:hypothetical protein FQR65_LT20152 [Abscondita terminalis]